MKQMFLAVSTIVLSILFATIVCGCCGEIAYPAYSYTIHVNGLTNFFSNSSTIILLPVPVMDDKQLFDSAQVNSRSGDWNVTLVDTEYGKMVSLKTNKTNLSDIDIEYSELILKDRPINRYDQIMNKALEAPLRPVSSRNSQFSVYQEIPSRYRAWNYSFVKNYSSYVSIDKNIRPISENNCSIEIILEYGLFRGMSPGRGGTQDWAGIHEFIPAGITGYVTVTTCVWTTPK